MKKKAQKKKNVGDTGDRCSRGWTLSLVSSFMICKHYHIHTKRQWLECKRNCDAMRCDAAVTWWYSKSFHSCYPCDRLLMLWIWKLQFKEKTWKHWMKPANTMDTWMTNNLHTQRENSIASIMLPKPPEILKW